MQKEFTHPGPVLDEKGVPNPGYSTRSILTYERKAIKASPFRIKEWDFYQVSDQNMCLQFTVGHASYAGQVGIMMFDFTKGEMLVDKGNFLVLPFNSLHLPENAEQDHVISYHKKSVDLSIEAKRNTRNLYCKWEDFEANIVLTRQNMNSLVITIPFDEAPTALYYNQKINCMLADGVVKYQGKEYYFSPPESFGILDWGRGVWPFHNEWYWSNGTGFVGDKIFGFNLGCGFGNTQAATENILFYGDSVSKLGEVVFELESDYMKPWHIYDKEGRLDLIMTPTYDRTTRTKLLWVNNCCHQLFGSFSGKVILDDGTELKIDNIVSFAEHAVNNW